MIYFIYIFTKHNAQRPISIQIYKPISNGLHIVLYYIFQQIETELKVLNKEYEDYVKEVNDVNNEHYAELKGFVEQGYVDRKPAARLVMKDDFSKKKGERSISM